MANKEVDGYVDEDVVERKETWKDFIFNSDKGTFLGRTGMSWLKIGVFYLIFYACLVGWFAGLLHAFYSTLDDVAPKYYGVNSLLQDNPAIGVRPMPLFDSTLIRYTSGRRSSYQPYTDHLEAFFKTYAPTPNLPMCNESSPVSETEGCNFDIDGYLKSAGCDRSTDYGFKENKPCVVLKMNKLYGFEPIPYDSEADIKADLNDDEKFRYYSFAPGNVGVSCDGQNAVDAMYLRDITFFPTNGYDKKFFPYLNQVGYRSPIILAKFEDIEKGSTVQVRCMLWAKNIDSTDGKEKRGTVHFEFYIGQE